MYIHAQLSNENICTGYGNLKNIETHPDLVYLPDGWDEDLKWRKYVNGAWTAEKFLPPAPGPSEIDKEIAFLKQRDTQLQDDNTVILDALIAKNILV